jgi:molybdopterin-containing oxidoreductase family iron-sulfur binding subunit
MHVRVREGRPVKVEGNPENPINRGRLCARGHSSLQGLYNPDRVRQPMVRNASGGFDPVTWDEALATLSQQISGVQGSNVWFLTGNENGSFGRLVDEWLQALGSQNRVVFEPFGYEALRYANQTVFGVDAIPHYDFAAAEHVMSFGADFLETWISPVQYAREFVAGHAYRDGRMGRFIHVEPRMSMTGYSADEWIAPQPGTDGILALGLARLVLEQHGGNAPADAGRLSGMLAQYTATTVASTTGVPIEVIERVAEEFAASPSLAVAGGVGAQHAQAHATAAAVNILNYVAGNVGSRVNFGAAYSPDGGSTYQGLLDFVGATGGGGVGVLLIHGINPVHTAPMSRMAGAIEQAGFTVSFSRYLDETSRLANLILPDHDPLEQWNDFEPGAGAYTLQQPVIRPLYDTRQTGDVLLTVASQAGGALASQFSAATYKEYLQASWQRLQTQIGVAGSFENFWNESLRAGGRHVSVATRNVSLAQNVEQMTFAPWQAGGGMPLLVYPSSVFYDGRGANRPWLQELPDPVSKMTWSSWVEINPETAAEHGISNGDLVEVTTSTGSAVVPAVLYPGIMPGVLAMPTGQGHADFGRFATDRGANPFALLDGEATEFGGLSFYAGATVALTGDHERLANNVGSDRQLGRGIAQSTTLAHLEEEEEYHPFHVAHAAEVPEEAEHAIEEWQRRQVEEWQIGNYAGEHPRWGLSIDLSRCTGCSACVTACYSENNIATGGKNAVQRGREMAWIRIERYFEGGEDGQPLTVELLPMMCQQCGRAPCEPVCPVFAAYHTPDGLNGQVYNRCVGTRYCANNCPYKVRYFNWFDHGNANDPAFSWPEPLHMLLNPDVTVRSKGVMEKCTFCVQRIRGAQNTARIERRELTDGEIQTACQQTCPAEAIVFGDLNDPNSEVSRWRNSQLAYRVLEGLNTDPGVTYLTRVRNAAE